jgi:cell division protein FtsQ
VKIFLKILTTLFIAAYLFMVLGFTGKQYDAVLCKGLKVVVRDSLENRMVTSGDVARLVGLEYGPVAGIPVASIDAAGIEESLMGFPAIADAQVYDNIEGELMIEVRQRTPVARIEDGNHSVYYLDADGWIIPASLNYSPHVLHISGYIPGKYREMKHIVREEGETVPAGLMDEILRLAVYIYSDPFWKSQIVQVYVNREGDIELIPRVGAHIILLGDASRLETKFFKLRTLYREGFTHTGWNQYEIINLKYHNQVICTKR